MKKIILMSLIAISHLSFAGDEVGGGGGLPIKNARTLTIDSELGIDVLTRDFQNPLISIDRYSDFDVKKSEIHRVFINPKKVDFALDNQGSYIQLEDSLKQEIPTRKLESIGLESGQIINFK